MSEPEDNVASCETCRFWEAISEDGGMGECRRHAPTLHIQGHIEVYGRSEGYPTDALEGMWPRTAHNDWCGEFQ
jgi:hypothetical protein